MYLVVVGAKDRDTEADRVKVNELMEMAIGYYPDCVFVTMLCNVGIGKFVKEAALKRNAAGGFRFRMVEFRVQIYANGLTRAETAQIYLARNPGLYEIGDMFYFFVSSDRRGSLEDLVQNRVKPGNRPYKVFMPGDPVELVALSNTKGSDE